MLGKSLLILQEYYPLFWYGVKITLLLSMLGTIFGLVLGLILGGARSVVIEERECSFL